MQLQMLPRTTLELYGDPWALSWLPPLRFYYHQTRYYRLAFTSKSLWVVTAVLRINEGHGPSLASGKAAYESL